MVEKEDLADEYLGIPKDKIPELKPAYLEGLTEAQKRDVLKRWRCVKEFEDGNAVGRIMLDNVTVASFNEFRKISRQYFGNSDGPCLAALTQLFLLQKRMQSLSGVEVVPDGN